MSRTLEPGDFRADIGHHEREEMRMLLALAVILFVLAIAGGIVIHPLLFILAVLALLVLFGGRRGSLA
jgi:flagellar biosynthesis component FlhA